MIRIVQKSERYVPRYLYIPVNNKIGIKMQENGRYKAVSQLETKFNLT